MVVENSSRKASWQPPKRPDWVARVNEEGKHLDIAGIVPLDESSLIATATANTGLSDFGADDWREPFRRLLNSYNTESNLNLIGRIMTRSDLLMFLEARLRVEDAYKRHPEISEQEIRKPFFIFGQGRSGTSILHILLSLDPQNRTTYGWDSTFPVEFKIGEQDLRREIADARISMWNRVTPEIYAMHRFGGDEPAECIQIESLSLRTPAWLNLLGLAPSYNAYISKEDYCLSYEYLKRVLKLLQWQSPGKRWVLKSPEAISTLPQLLKVFPDVQFIWPHRDPIKAVSSGVSLIGTLTWIRSDQRPVSGAFDRVVDPAHMALGLNRAIDWIEEGIVPKAQLCNIQYAELISNPVETLESIYAYFGVSCSEAFIANVANYFRENPREKHPAHSYSTGSAEEVSAERQLLKRYQAYFNVPTEGGL